ncbi:MAG: hypothetical protein FWD92_04065 [Methanomassiliicoccaceae archaeon]|nr:hypothetical protein [Methanomassiliicoccaceae archaeon]
MSAETIFYLITLTWFMFFLGYLYYNKKCAGYRKSAFLAMKKIRIVFYCIPLFISIILAIIAYPILEEGYFPEIASLWIVMIGIMIGVILFNMLESEKVKRLAE